MRHFWIEPTVKYSCTQNTVTGYTYTHTCTCTCVLNAVTSLVPCRDSIECSMCHAPARMISTCSYDMEPDLCTLEHCTPISCLTWHTLMLLTTLCGIGTCTCTSHPEWGTCTWSCVPGTVYVGTENISARVSLDCYV